MFCAWKNIILLLLLFLLFLEIQNQTNLLSLSGSTLCVTAGSAPSLISSPSPPLLCQYVNLQLLNANPQGACLPQLWVVGCWALRFPVIVTLPDLRGFLRLASVQWLRVPCALGSTHKLSMFTQGNTLVMWHGEEMGSVDQLKLQLNEAELFKCQNILILNFALLFSWE